VFTAVPTIYSKLIENYDAKLASRPQTREFVQEQCSQMIRLMMCGSAALPESIHRRWSDITGHNLLERYGMTECGMALTNPLNGERIPGRNSSLSRRTRNVTEMSNRFIDRHELTSMNSFETRLDSTDE
jgi:acyl-CoA synthetase (AMP-forming)/AMP-acid ligase II